MIAHVSGVPVEEMLASLAGGGALLIAARTWITVRFRRGKESKS